MTRRERSLREGWFWRPELPGGRPAGDWRAVEIPSPWQRYEGGWNHEGFGRYRIDLPPAEDSANTRWILFNGVLYNSRVRYDGRLLGRHEGGWDPFWLPLPRGEGTLEVLVEAVGPTLPKEEVTSGFLPDCGVLPAGIWKEVALVESASAIVTDALIRWKPSKGVLQVTPILQHASRGRARLVSIELLRSGELVSAAKGDPARFRTFALDVPSPRLWRIEDPFLYTLRVAAEDESGRADSWEGRIGLRDLRARAGQLLLNNEPVMLKGALNWGYHPGTLVQPLDEDFLRKEILATKELGFNLIKHCLYVPHDLYFRLGDETGVVQWLELPMWLPSGSDIFRRRALREFPRIVRAFQHHPSLLLYSLGCELNDKADSQFLGKLHRSVQRLAPNGLLCDNSGSGDCYGGPETGLSSFYDYHFYAEPNNLPALLDAFLAPWRPDKPLLFGEFCDSDAFRDLEEIRNALDEESQWWLSRDPKENLIISGGRTQPELACLFQEERLARLGLEGSEARLLEAARRHSRAHRKMTLEAARKHPRTAGYVVTGIRDTPITPSGVFDDLGRPRIEAQEWRRMNEETLLLLMPPPRRAWIHGGDRRSGYDLHHHMGGSLFETTVCASLYGTVPKAGGELTWELKAEGGGTMSRGVLDVRPVKKRGLNVLGALRIEIPDVKATFPCRLHLAWHVGESRAENSWPLYIHPASLLEEIREIHLHDPSGSLDVLEGLKGGEDARVWVASSLDQAVRGRLEGGGPVIWVLNDERSLGCLRLPFWRECFHLIGDHPLAGRFPFSDGGGDELYALTTDRFFQRRLDETGFTGLRPILTRLDARAFRLSYSLAELDGFPGRCLALTLNLAGGLHDLPHRLRNNRAGCALLKAMKEDLCSK